MKPDGCCNESRFSYIPARYGIFAEKAGFEPAKQFDPLGAFRVRCHRPLGHLSGTNVLIIFEECYNPCTLRTNSDMASSVVAQLVQTRTAVCPASTGLHISKEKSVDNCSIASLGSMGNC